VKEAVVQMQQDEAARYELLNRIKAELTRVREYTPKVGIFGDTGVGKSSLCNALFGKEIAEISDVEACTRRPQEILLGEKDKGGIVLVDVPGVGEDPQRHEEYVALYKNLVPNLDLVLWAVKADDRKYLSAINVYKEVLLPNLQKCPVIFVITQVDKIEPHREWDIGNNKPGSKQEANIKAKAYDISARFDISANKIIAVSSSDGYNLVELVNRVVEVLPNEKKYSFAREAKVENVSEEAAISAEKGVLDHIMEFAGKAWDTVKEVVVPVLVESAAKAAKHIAKKALAWIKLWF
jgi:predicted GTPase